MELDYNEQLNRLEELRQLVEQGKVKPEVYDKLENEIFKKESKALTPKRSKKGLQNKIRKSLKRKRKPKKGKLQKLKGVESVNSSVGKSSVSLPFRGRSNSQILLKPSINGLELDTPLEHTASLEKNLKTTLSDSFLQDVDEVDTKDVKNEAEFNIHWQIRENKRLTYRNQQLKKTVQEKEDEIRRLKAQLALGTVNEPVTSAGFERLKKENAELRRNYEELKAKYKAESHVRYQRNKEEQKTLNNTIALLNEKESDNIETIEELKRVGVRLKVIENEMQEDMKAMDWDGSYEQAELKMQECLNLIVKGNSPMVRAKAEKDFEIWKNLVASQLETRWQEWEERNRALNVAAWEEMRERYVPEEYRDGCSIQTIIELKGVTMNVAKRIFRNKIFRFLWMEKEEIAKIHPVSLSSDYSSHGLDIRELRAIYATLPEEFDSDGDGRKKQFRENIRGKLFRLTEKEKADRLTPQEKKHSAYRNKTSKPSAKGKRIQDRINRLKAGGKDQNKTVDKKEEPEIFNPDDKKYEKYLDMQRHLPVSVIKQKMMMNGDNPDFWEELLKAKANAPSIKRFHKKSNQTDIESAKEELKNSEVWNKLIFQVEQKNQEKEAEENDTESDIDIGSMIEMLTVKEEDEKKSVATENTKVTRLAFLRKKSEDSEPEDNSQLEDIIDFIINCGDDNESGGRTMKFGTIYNTFLELCDVLPAILLKAKRDGQLTYKGQLLLFGIHNNVKIIVSSNTDVKQEDSRAPRRVISRKVSKELACTDVAQDLKRAMTKRRKNIRSKSKVNFEKIKMNTEKDKIQSRIKRTSRKSCHTMLLNTTGDLAKLALLSNTSNKQVDFAFADDASHSE